MRLKNTLLSILAAGTILLAPKLAEGVNVSGYFINSPNCSTKVYRKPTGSVDTLWTVTDSWNYWQIGTEQFIPEAQQGETLYVDGGWNLGGKAKASWIRGPPGENQVYDLHLDKFTGCIDEIIDTSGLADTIPLMCEYWISGFDPETTGIDTSFNWYQYYDLHIPFDTLQAQQGAMAHYKLFKKVIDSPDTLYVKEDSFLINKDAFDAQLIREKDTFPKEKIVIGVEENNKPVPKKERIVKQTIGTRFDIKGSWELYDLIGNKVTEYQNGNDQFKNHNLGMYPQGVYFLKKEKEDGKDLIEKIIILR